MQSVCKCVCGLLSRKQFVLMGDRASPDTSHFSVRAKDSAFRFDGEISRSHRQRHDDDKESHGFKLQSKSELNKRQDSLVHPLVSSSCDSRMTSLSEQTENSESSFVARFVCRYPPILSVLEHRLEEN